MRIFLSTNSTTKRSLIQRRAVRGKVMLVKRVETAIATKSTYLLVLLLLYFLSLTLLCEYLTSRSRNKSVSSQKTTRSDEKPIVTIRKRGKYPVVSYELNQSNISAAGDSTKVLRALLHDICETESLALQQCFQQSDWTLDAKGKKLILESLLTVLAALPEEMLLNCPANVEFLPEFSSETKLKIASLKNDRDVMKAHLAKLNTYVNDLSAMGAECNLSFSLTSIAQVILLYFFVYGI